MHDHHPLAEFVAETADRLGVPGVAAAVWAEGREHYACSGVTSVDNPLPVDRDTMFLLGSVSKTFTATVVMRLVAEGRVDLDAPIRRYVPEFRLADEAAAAQITVLQLLNHTAGLEWRLNADTGEGDDALAAYVAAMAESKPIAAPGTLASYSEGGYNLAGRMLEKLTGQTYEQAVSSMLFEPLGLSRTAYFATDVMIRRFAVGHKSGSQGSEAAVSQWGKGYRADNPGGGVVASPADLLRWVRFHLGDGRSEAGVRLLPADMLHRMRIPTAELRSRTLGDAIGICWFLRDVGGVSTIGHGGSTNGQFSDVLLVPADDFGVGVMSNVGPDSGLAFNRAVLGWALEHYLGIREHEPQLLPHDPKRAQELVGTYENEMMRITVATDGAELTVACALKPEVRAAAKTEVPPDLPAASMGLLVGTRDEYVVTGGGLKGQRGFFTRAESGAVVAMDLGGRLFKRAPA